LVVACLVMALAASAGASPLDWITGFLTDAATRLARDLRDGAGRLESSRDGSRTVIHRMKARPEGCAHGYRVQMAAAAAIVVWCRSADGRDTTGSYSTTSHLPAVDVPRTWIVDKGAGEPLYVELAATGAKPSVTRVY
jgi:hypothetical protein